MLPGHSKALTSATFTSNGRILTSSRDGTARLWFADPQELLEYARGRKAHVLTPEDRQRYLRTSPRR